MRSAVSAFPLLAGAALLCVLVDTRGSVAQLPVTAPAPVQGGAPAPFTVPVVVAGQPSAPPAPPAAVAPSPHAGPADPAASPVPGGDPVAAIRDVGGTPAAGNASGSGTALNNHWRNGLRFESADKSLSLFVGGRAQLDVVDYIAPATLRQAVPGNNPLEPGVSFRRVRLDMGGTLYKNIEFFTQIDFVNGFVTSVADNRQTNAPAPTDVWVQFKDLPYVGNVRVGNQKPLYSFEHLTSSRFLNFLERSLGFDAFAENQDNGFQPGITVFDTYADKRGTWGVGLFKNTRSIFGYNVGRNEQEVNGRVTYLPVYEDEGRYLVHVGLGAACRDLDQDQARLRARFDARNSPSAFSALIADTALFFGSHQQLLIPELVAVAGRWSFQSEYYASWVGDARLVGPDNTRLADMGTVYFQSVYGEVHYFLTGEHHEYSRDAGTFTRVTPRNPLAWTRCGFTGWGAWQVAARYSYLDLNSKGVRGGEVHDMTLGLNWFLNPNMKLQGNYFLAHRNAADPDGDGFIHGFAMRSAIDF